MRCPFCSHPDTQVVETRIAEDGDFIRRRRQCGACEKRFTTYERPEVNFPAVVKKDGRRIEYERSKLSGSMNLALRKRPVSTEQIDAAIERIEEKILNLGAREIEAGRLAAAEAALRRAVAVDPGSAQAFGNLGETLHAARQHFVTASLVKAEQCVCKHSKCFACGGRWLHSRAGCGCNDWRGTC